MSTSNPGRADFSLVNRALDRSLREDYMPSVVAEIERGNALLARYHATQPPPSRWERMLRPFREARQRVRMAMNVIRHGDTDWDD